MGDSAPPFVQAGLSLFNADPPVPISATPAGLGIVVVFDRPLQTGIITSTNWSFRLANARWFITDATATGSSVIITGSEDESDFGPDTVTYEATVPDVISLAGTPAAAFTDFPIT